MEQDYENRIKFMRRKALEIDKIVNRAMRTDRMEREIGSKILSEVEAIKRAADEMRS